MSAEPEGIAPKISMHERSGLLGQLAAARRQLLTVATSARREPVAHDHDAVCVRRDHVPRTAGSVPHDGATAWRGRVSRLPWRLLVTLTSIMIITGGGAGGGAFDRLAARIELCARTRSAASTFAIVSWSAS